MIDGTLFLAFFTTTLLFVVVPGPSVAFATAQALRHGARGAVVTVAGDALGTVVHIVVAASSLSALIAVSELVLPPLQILGGMFVVYMAWQTFRGAAAGEHSLPVRASDTASFWAGFFTCVSNPKAIVFFVALFPAFISPQYSVVVQSAVYGAVFLVLDAVFLLGYALLTMQAVRRTTSRWFNPHALSALGLAGVGVAMMVKGWRAIPRE